MKPIKESSPKTRRKFDATFKREAVGNWLSSGKSAAVVAKELGLTEGLLFAWRKLLPSDAAGGERRRGAGGPPPPTYSPNSMKPGVRTATCASNATF